MNRATQVMLLALALSAAFITAAPTASAGPNCIQVYPWSELCNGDVDDFVCYFVQVDPDGCTIIGPG